MLKASKLFLHEKIYWYTFLHGYVLVHIYVQLINSFVGNSAILLHSCYKKASFYLTIIMFLESTTHCSEESHRNNCLEMIKFFMFMASVN